jgi:drug/metabolite transporter (DMT)-like permease
MYPSPILGPFLAISSALTYGSADFFGGVATKRNHPFAVLMLSSSIGVPLMLLLAILRQEILPDLHSMMWACLAGLAGTIGLALLYQGLANGSPVIVSPVSGMAGAALPAFFSAIIHQPPTIIQLTGFLTALPAIYFVSQSRPSDLTQVKFTTLSKGVKGSLRIGFTAGIFFGLFFILLAQIKSESLFFSLAISKATAFLLGASITRVARLPLPDILSNPAILLAGILDPTANGLYLFSLQFTRLDIAAVLTSLYPAGTVWLAYLFQKEPILKRQWLGFGLCLLTIILITS